MPCTLSGREGLEENVAVEAWNPHGGASSDRLGGRRWGFGPGYIPLCKLPCRSWGWRGTGTALPALRGKSVVLRSGGAAPERIRGWPPFLSWVAAFCGRASGLGVVWSFPILAPSCQLWDWRSPVEDLVAASACWRAAASSSHGRIWTPPLRAARGPNLLLQVRLPGLPDGLANGLGLGRPHHRFPLLVFRAPVGRPVTQLGVLPLLLGGLSGLVVFVVTGDGRRERAGAGLGGTLRRVGAGGEGGPREGLALGGVGVAPGGVGPLGGL